MTSRHIKKRNREVAEAAKKVMKKPKEEMEKKGLKMSVTENGKEGTTKMIASCGFLEDVQNGKGSEGRSQRLSESGSKQRRLRRKSGSGKEVLSRILSVKANGTGVFQFEEVGVREAQELEFASRRLQGRCCHGRLFAGKSRNVRSMWLGSGAVGL